MAQKWFLMSLAISAVLSFGCDIETPEIRGVVLDAETKQPVPEAWITATLAIRTKTVAGDTHRYLAVEVPHTRTDNNGRFVIPANAFDTPSFPFGFGTDIEGFGVGASTADDRGGDVSLKKLFEKDRIEVEIYIKPQERTEREYFIHLQALFNYCQTGRFFVEVPAVKGGCDDWELDYAVTKHKNYLKKFKKTDETRSHCSLVLEQLGYLFEKKGEYESAIESLGNAKEIRYFQPQYLENEIKRIRNKMK